MLPVLDIDTVHAYRDPQTNISYIIYKGAVDARTTTAVYEWVKELLTVIDNDETRGVLMDFRQVLKFMPDHISTVRRESKDLNREQKLVHPVAMIVTNLYQEQMVKVSVRISDRPQHVQFFYSLEEGLAFFDEWNSQHRPLLGRKSDEASSAGQGDEPTDTPHPASESE